MRNAKSTPHVLALALVFLLLAACGGPQVEPTTLPKPPATATPTPSATIPAAVLPAPTATPTPTALLSRADEPTPSPTPPELRGGHLEIRIPYAIVVGGGEPPADVPECVCTIPFRMFRDGERIMIAGEGPIDCHFVSTGGPITIHVLLEFEGVLDGELLPATSDWPSGWLDAYLMVEGTISQYYLGYPPQATNPCPEGDPCRAPASQVISLPLACEEGGTVTTPWTFVLHLQ